MSLNPINYYNPIIDPLIKILHPLRSYLCVKSDKIYKMVFKSGSIYKTFQQINSIIELSLKCDNNVHPENP
jgi:hypothetical protein